MVSVIVMAKKCIVCENEFETDHPGRKMCSEDCQKIRQREHIRKGQAKYRAKLFKNRQKGNHQDPDIKKRKCPKCKVDQEITDFSKDKHSFLGYSYQCKDCRNKKKNEYRKTEVAKVVRRKRENQLRAKDSDYKLRKNVSSMIARALKTADGSKNGHSIFDYLPYSLDELKEHLEKQFEDWMTWENYGRANVSADFWNIDHIVPQSKLIYGSMDHLNFQKCWDLNNLRPLEARENIKKLNKLLEEAVLDD
jgi:predicted nucleic acid-binding Zn ribbon protein